MKKEHKQQPALTFDTDILALWDQVWTAATITEKEKAFKQIDKLSKAKGLTWAGLPMPDETKDGRRIITGDIEPDTAARKAASFQVPRLVYQMMFFAHEFTDCDDPVAGRYGGRVAHYIDEVLKVFNLDSIGRPLEITTDPAKLLKVMTEQSNMRVYGNKQGIWKGGRATP